MALGNLFGSRATVKPEQISDTSPPPANDFGKDGYYEGFSPDAPVAEDGGRTSMTGPGGRKMSRIDRPVTKSISGSIAGRGAEPIPDDATDTSLSVGKQMEMEAGNAIKYRTCSWYKTAALLFSEYICLAIMSFPYSYSVLGLVPGLILTVVIAGLVLYTSLVVW
jgi:hypothetical protein